jgi:hypothetical protein
MAWPKRERGMAEMLDAALQCNALGLSAFPLTRRGKKAAIEWARYQKERPSETQIKSWWHHRPDANIAVACGPVSRVLVVDVDGDKGAATIARLQETYGPLPVTWRSRTGKGEHIWFRYPEGAEIGNARGQLKNSGVDIRGDGGYVVAPGSIHENGTRYIWRDGAHPDRVPLADMPQWFLDLLKEPTKPADTAPQAPAAPAIATDDRYVAAALKGELAAVAGALEGERNSTLNTAAFKLAGFIAAGKLTESEIRSALTHAALSVGLSLPEIEATIDSGIEAGIQQPREMPEPRSSPARRPGERRTMPGNSSQAVESDRRALRSLTIGELLALELPPREYILSPIVPRRGLVMLFAQRGIGKTYTALSIAYAVASGGSALKWHAPKPRRVLYIDGEMPLEALQERLADITAGAENEPPAENLRLLAADYQEWMPDLSTHEGQAALEPFLDGTEFVVLDNLSTLVRCEGESESDSWIPIQEWLLKLRRRGITVLLVHHAGKNGSQRGTSKREDILDTIIALKRPGDYDAAQGARFEVHLEKARGISGDDAKSFEASLQISDTPTDRSARWVCTEMEDARLNSAVELFKLKMSVRDVATELTISKSTAQRLRDKAREKGLLDG